jgi:hypothetical protein
MNAPLAGAAEKEIIIPPSVFEIGHRTVDPNAGGLICLAHMGKGFAADFKGLT